MKYNDALISVIKAELANNTLSHWDAFDPYPPSDWMSEVANGDTRRGYWDWVINNLECDEENVSEEDIVLPITKGT